MSVQKGNQKGILYLTLICILKRFSRHDHDHFILWISIYRYIGFFQKCLWMYYVTSSGLRESHAVILRDRVVPASQVPFPGEPSGEPGNGTWRAGTTLYRRNDSVGFFFSPVTIKLLQRIRTKTSFDQFCIRFIRIYRLLWSSARVRNELLTNHRRTWYQNPRWRSLNTTGMDLSHVWCDPTYFHYPTTKSKK